MHCIDISSDHDPRVTAQNGGVGAAVRGEYSKVRMCMMYILLMESGGGVAQITEMRWIANIEPDKRNNQ
jgi:hypothetical protein